MTPKKQHRTAFFDTPREVAIAFAAQHNEELDLGMPVQRRPRIAASLVTSTVLKKFEVRLYLRHVGKPPVLVLPTVACAMLSEQQAADAAARGVAVATLMLQRSCRMRFVCRLRVSGASMWARAA